MRLSRAVPEPAYLTLKAVAQRWGVSPKTVRRLARVDLLGATRQGRTTYLIPIAEVRAFEKRRLASGAAEERPSSCQSTRLFEQLSKPLP